MCTTWNTQLAAPIEKRIVCNCTHQPTLFVRSSSSVSSFASVFLSIRLFVVQKLDCSRSLCLSRICIFLWSLQVFRGKIFSLLLEFFCTALSLSRRFLFGLQKTCKQFERGGKWLRLNVGRFSREHAVYDLCESGTLHMLHFISENLIFGFSATTRLRCSSSCVRKLSANTQQKQPRNL